MSTPLQYDFGVIGGGLLGLAVARELRVRFPSARVVVLEKESQIATGQTASLMGTVMSGASVSPQCAGARATVDGSQRLLDYCAARGVPHLRCGEVVIGRERAELGRVYEMYRRAVLNGVPGAQVLVQKKQLDFVEPAARAYTSLWTPTTGTVDYVALARAFAEDVCAAPSTELSVAAPPSPDSPPASSTPDAAAAGVAAGAAGGEGPRGSGGVLVEKANPLALALHEDMQLDAPRVRRFPMMYEPPPLPPPEAVPRAEGQDAIPQWAMRYNDNHPIEPGHVDYMRSRPPAHRTADAIDLGLISPAVASQHGLTPASIFSPPAPVGDASLAPPMEPPAEPPAEPVDHQEVGDAEGVERTAFGAGSNTPGGAERAGSGEILTSFCVSCVELLPGGGLAMKSTAGQRVNVLRAISCAGIFADRVGLLCGGRYYPRIQPFHHDFYELHLPKSRGHITRVLTMTPADVDVMSTTLQIVPQPDGRVLCGPHWHVALWRSLQEDPFDLLRTLGSVGFWAMMRKYRDHFWVEGGRMGSSHVMYMSAVELVPNILPEFVIPFASAKMGEAILMDGSFCDQLYYEAAYNSQMVHLRAAPHWSASACLNVAREVVAYSRRAFGLADEESFQSLELHRPYHATEKAHREW